MKKNVLLLLLIVAISFSSCATLLGGRITDSQRIKPQAGETTRQVRWVAVIADVLIFPPYLVVDFLTKAIYVPKK